MLEVGRICVKTAGREAGKYCVIVNVVDKNFVTITGPRELTGIKRRKCNILHLEALQDKLALSQDAPDLDVLKAYQEAGLFHKLNIQPPSEEERKKLQEQKAEKEKAKREREEKASKEREELEQKRKELGKKKGEEAAGKAAEKKKKAEPKKETKKGEKEEKPAIVKKEDKKEIEEKK